MRPTKSHYFLTCWNCARLTVRQNPVHLTTENSVEAVHDFPGLENTCEHFPPCPGKRCEWWERRRSEKITKLMEEEAGQLI